MNVPQVGHFGVKNGGGRFLLSPRSYCTKCISTSEFQKHQKRRSSVPGVWISSASTDTVRAHSNIPFSEEEKSPFHKRKILGDRNISSTLGRVKLRMEFPIPPSLAWYCRRVSGSSGLLWSAGNRHAMNQPPVFSVYAFSYQAKKLQPITISRQCAGVSMTDLLQKILNKPKIILMFSEGMCGVTTSVAT